jgi:NAD(P)-dependent dehydrogenase (short-subunit alcohol dehydrogenase family)
MNSVRSKAPEVVAITGASAGVGRAVVHEFARAGWRIALIARDAEALEEVRSEVEKLGGSAIVVPADVSVAEAVFAAADSIARSFGGIDVWINDAMVTVFAPAWEMTPEEFRRVTEITYLGCVHGTMAALRHMRPVNRGKIIQIGSALAYRGIPLQSAYCGSKYAIRGFTDSLRTELLHEHSRISVTMVELPAVNTPQFDWARTHMPRQPRPVAPVVEPEVVAKAVFGVVADPRRELWIGLSTLKVILGNMVLPEFLDRYLAKMAIRGQQTNQPVSADRKDNLTAPVHGPHRVHGRFGSEAQNWAVSTGGPLARTAPLVIGGIMIFLSGWLMATPRRGRLSGPRSPAINRNRPQHQGPARNARS